MRLHRGARCALAWSLALYLDIPEGCFEIEYRGRTDILPVSRYPMGHDFDVALTTQLSFLARGSTYGTILPGVNQALATDLDWLEQQNPEAYAQALLLLKQLNLTRAALAELSCVVPRGSSP